mmetsp:Transcript_61599/g.190778  ORF Transcript_61599/g.190778 Transcript_61599/m.190778 type:complete len:223 (-) Transcript_61599:34-702(-)
MAYAVCPLWAQENGDGEATRGSRNMVVELNYVRADALQKLCRGREALEEHVVGPHPEHVSVLESPLLLVLQHLVIACGEAADHGQQVAVHVCAWRAWLFERRVRVHLLHGHGPDVPPDRAPAQVHRSVGADEVLVARAVEVLEVAVLNVLIQEDAPLPRDAHGYAASTASSVSRGAAPGAARPTIHGAQHVDEAQRRAGRANVPAGTSSSAAQSSAGGGEPP